MKRVKLVLRQSGRKIAMSVPETYSVAMLKQKIQRQLMPQFMKGILLRLEDGDYELFDEDTVQFVLKFDDLIIVDEGAVNAPNMSYPSVLAAPSGVSRVAQASGAPSGAGAGASPSSVLPSSSLRNGGPIQPPTASTQMNMMGPLMPQKFPPSMAQSSNQNQIPSQSQSQMASSAYQPIQPMVPGSGLPKEPNKIPTVVDNEAKANNKKKKKNRNKGGTREPSPISRSQLQPMPTLRTRVPPLAQPQPQTQPPSQSQNLIVTDEKKLEKDTTAFSSSQASKKEETVTTNIEMGIDRDEMSGEAIAYRMNPFRYNDEKLWKYQSECIDYLGSRLRGEKIYESEWKYISQFKSPIHQAIWKYLSSTEKIGIEWTELERKGIESSELERKVKGEVAEHEWNTLYYHKYVIFLQYLRCEFPKDILQIVPVLVDDNNYQIKYYIRLSDYKTPLEKQIQEADCVSRMSSAQIHRQLSYDPTLSKNLIDSITANVNGESLLQMTIHDWQILENQLSETEIEELMRPFFFPFSGLPRCETIITESKSIEKKSVDSTEPPMWPLTFDYTLFPPKESLFEKILKTMPIAAIQQLLKIHENIDRNRAREMALKLIPNDAQSLFEE